MIAPDSSSGRAPSSPGMPIPLLTCDGVRIDRDGRTVVSGLNVTVRRGEIVCIIGPNGVGKSTALAAFAGDLAPNAGSVDILGQAIQKLGAAPLARLRAVCTQEHRFAFGFSVAEVVAMGTWCRNDAEPVEVSVANALGLVGLVGFEHRQVTRLSGGEQARVAFARMLAQNAPLLLVDEPTAALDLRYQHQVMQALRDHADQSGGVVAVLHDLALVAQYADRVLVMGRGGSIHDAEPRDAALDPDRLSEAYGCAMTKVSTSFGAFPVAVPCRSRTESAEEL